MALSGESTVYPCEPPATPGNSVATSRTSQASSQVLTARKSGGSRTSTSPETSASSSATATATGIVASAFQPARAVSSAVEKAPALMNAP